MNAHKKLATGPAFSGIPCLRRHKIIWQMTICSTIIDYHFYKKAPFPFFLFFAKSTLLCQGKLLYMRLQWSMWRIFFKLLQGSVWRKYFQVFCFPKNTNLIAGRYIAFENRCLNLNTNVFSMRKSSWLISTWEYRRQRQFLDIQKEIIMIRYMKKISENPNTSKNQILLTTDKMEKRKDVHIVSSRQITCNSLMFKKMGFMYKITTNVGLLLKLCSRKGLSCKAFR